MPACLTLSRSMNRDAGCFSQALWQFCTLGKAVTLAGLLLTNNSDYLPVNHRALQGSTLILGIGMPVALAGSVNHWERRMSKARQIFFAVSVTMLLIGSTAMTFAARKGLDRNKAQATTAQHSRSATRHHRRRSSTKRSRRIANAKSLKNLSW
jgi:hypothetical protein